MWGCIVSSGVVVTSLEPENDAATNFALMKITGTFIFQYRNCNMCKGSCKLSVAQSVKRIDTGWTVWESNPGGGEIFRTGPTGPGAHPSSYTTGTVSFPGVKWSERGFDHPPSSSAQVKERVELYLYSPSVPSWPVIGWTKKIVSRNKLCSLFRYIEGARLERVNSRIIHTFSKFSKYCACLLNKERKSVHIGCYHKTLRSPKIAFPLNIGWCIATYVDQLIR